MTHAAGSFTWLSVGLVLALGCGGEAARRPATPSPAAPITVLVFGDSGYSTELLDPTEPLPPTRDAYVAAERAEWLEEKRPAAEFVTPPPEVLPGRGVAARSGLAPVARAMGRFCDLAGCDLAVMLGDNIYPDGATAGRDRLDAERFRKLFVEPFGGLARGRDDFRIYAALGNHDWRTSREGAMAQVDFLTRTPPFYMDGIFYRVVPPAARGEVELFVLDTEVLLAGVEVPVEQLDDGAREVDPGRVRQPVEWIRPRGTEREMAAWLERALASSTARWKIVLGHHPLWSSSGEKFQQARALRRLILPALCRHADLYLAGHEHTLELHSDDCRAALPGQAVAPLVEVVSGSAARQRAVNRPFEAHQRAANPQLEVSYARGMVWGFAHLTLDGDRAIIQIISTPNDGSGRPVVELTHQTSRRSGR